PASRWPAVRAGKRRCEGRRGVRRRSTTATAAPPRCRRWARKNQLVRILVVDDDRAVREALRRALTLAGYEVTPAEDGDQALEQVVRSVPDAVVLDIGLPGTDGLEVCRRVRMLGSRVPIRMLTARDAVADRIDGLDAGADDYLVKPFDLGELKARLRALVRRATGEEHPDEMSFAELKLDATRHGVGVDGKLVELTRT